ncbi:hypothetical protein ABIE26_005288 [Pedobacter africanus]|uniref:Uncharacterized protein n=1 Tax=Pedobacter africanus TaxID=151894 RepID=A0ACC6L5A2_9SPHI|nr:hypothetical protein [Pedobacter africanus]MDR6786526.1 hypothetical protein [Pedobacter africanus]
MKRRMIVGERIMYVDALTPLNCVFAVKICGSFSREALHKALFKLQQKHPLLRSSIKTYGNGVPYFVSSNRINEIPVRVQERMGDEDWQEQSRLEWERLFDGENMPLARVVWLKGTAVSELLLVCPHCVCDGTTFVTLMRELLMLLDQPGLELDSYQTFGSIESLLAPTFSRSTGKVFKAKFFAMLARLFFLLKSTRREQPVGKTYMLHWKLNADDTGALTAACRTAGATVHAALCVAFLDAFKQVRGAKAHGKVICPVDVRKFVPEIKADHMFAFAPIAELSLNPKMGGDLWTKARRLKDDLVKKVAEMKVHELLVMSEYFHASVSRMVRFLRSTDGTHDVTLSNMGRLPIPGGYSSFEVETIYSPTVGFPWRNANTLVVSTFKDEMDFTFFSNDAFLAEEEARAIKEAAMVILLKELEPSYV